MQFDPSKYRISETGDFEVTDAKGDVIYLDDEQTTPWTITVASPGTKKAMKADHKRAQSQKTDVFAQMAGKKSTRDEMSDTKDRATYLMDVVETTNAEGLVYNGATGMAALREIFLDPYMAHVAIGLEKFQADRGNFYKG